MILIISAVFPPEPVVSAQIMFDIASELSIYNDVTVLIPRPSRPKGFPFTKYSHDKNRYKVVILDSFVYPNSRLLGRFYESLSMGIKAAKYINENHSKINILYNGAWPIFGQYLIAKAANKYNIPYITSIQDLYPESIKSKLPRINSINEIILYPLYLIDKFILRNAYKIHVISKGMLEYVISSRHIERGNLHLIHNWQTLNLPKKQSSSAGNDIFTFMYLGNLGSLAGLELLIHAFVKINLKNTCLIIAGAGSEKTRLISIANKYTSHHIKFIDVPIGRVIEIQQQADVLLLPLKKNFASSSIPSKLIAYQFSGKPIIACVDSDSDTARVINESKCGWVIEPENINALSIKMSKAISIDKQVLQKMGENGYNFAKENYSREYNLKKFTALFKL